MIKQNNQFTKIFRACFQRIIFLYLKAVTLAFFVNFSAFLADPEDPDCSNNQQRYSRDQRYQRDRHWKM